jgi:4-amino-4-deoxy-L-arabinose transferase-like glycosyltransferase
MPLWEGLDEWAHFAYVHHVATFGTLPRPETPTSEEISRSWQLAPIPWSLQELPAPYVTHDDYWSLPQPERAARESALMALPATAQIQPGMDNLYEGKQPPLYYLMCVPLMKLVGGASLPARVLALRLFTLLLASLLVPLTFAIARRLFGETTPAMLASILVTSMPVLLMTASRIANDTLAIVLFSLLAWALLRSDPWDRRGSILIGITVGAGLLTKAYFIGAVPAVVFAGTMAIWNAKPGRRLRITGFVAAAGVVALIMAAWWYARILGAAGPVWADVAPATKLTAGELLGHAAQMPWWRAIKNAFDLHFYFAGWSFLSVRSWIYLVLRWVFLFLLLGGFVKLFRGRSDLGKLWLLYGGFWTAMMYHAFVTFLREGIPSSTGSYLYAVVACQTALLWSGIEQWFPPRWRSRAMAALIGLFLLLEMYATHFVLIPYYSGMIRHRPDGTLLSFVPTQAFDLGLPEVLRRLSLNKPEWLLISFWCAFLAASTGLFVMACRACRYKMTLSRSATHGGNP